MRERPITIYDLWSIPRVGAPVPSSDGTFVVVPVTTYSMGDNEGRTRLWWLATAPGGEPAARPLTSGDYSATQPSLSPDGTKLAFLRKQEKGEAQRESGPQHSDKLQIHVMPLDGGEPERLTDLPLGAYDPRWLPDGRLVFLGLVLPDAPSIEATARLLEEREKDPVRARVTEDRVYRYWDRWLSDSPIHHLMILDPGSREVLDLMPESRRLFPLMEPKGSYSASPDGREIAFTAARSEPPHSPFVMGVYRIAVPSEGARPATGSRESLLDPEHDGHAMRPVYSPDGKWIVYGIQRELDFYADRVRIVAHERATGTRTVLTEEWDRSADEWVFGDDPDRLILAAENEARREPFVLDIAPCVGSPGDHPPSPLAADCGWIGELCAVGGTLFSTMQSLASPPEVTAIAVDGTGARIVSKFTAPALAGIELGAVEEAFFEGHEGAEVQMFIVHPPPSATTGSPPPLVHLIHGGPHGVFGDQWHWRWNAQVVAAAGYLVSMVNFHGSSGWGQEFAASILGRWGDQPYTDVQAATDFLVEKGAVDATRMAVTGGSYGGYLVTWIVSQTDRFACAINHAGVCDFQGQLASDMTQGRRRSMGGELWGNIRGMDRFNPLRQASGFRTPMLVIHGENDHRVPYTQGLQVYNVYKAMGLPARLVIFPDENHWILKPQNSRLWYSEFLGWLERWMGARS